VSAAGRLRHSCTGLYNIAWLKIAGGRLAKWSCSCLWAWSRWSASVVSPRPWGWHELDSRWAKRLVADSGIDPGSLVLDIGAGRGSIAAALLEAGARVIAIEAHPDRLRYLRERFGSDLVVVQADASDLRLPRRPYRVVSNPPFAISTMLLKRLLQPGSRLVRADLILQDQSARRWSGPHAPGASRWQRDFFAVPRARVPPSAFRPPPPVPTRVLRIERQGPPRTPGVRRSRP
jgi:23S rRNA (adenine-N6)-dimethyltransferase